MIYETYATQYTDSLLFLLQAAGGGGVNSVCIMIEFVFNHNPVGSVG